MFIKICANTNLQDAQLAAELGADAVGFVFAPSRRRMIASQVAEITPHLPGSVLTVGVFATSDADEIIRAVREAGLQAAQLHNELDPDLIARLNDAFEGHIQLIQTVPFNVHSGNNAGFSATLARTLTTPGLRAVLVDAARRGQSGGLGMAFDWQLAAQEIRLACNTAAATSTAELPPLIVAGGLHSRNVAAAIDVLKPWGVDVASGVEVSPGRKDPLRLRQFISAARGSAEWTEPWTPLTRKDDSNRPKT
ncbi:MAG TPA: phosphoribosylanthranilate isomerase [Acidobacteriaceae bacterium]|nr:phosphoribosylanthranilate isomerase [Acidobacteriaceae bacterium]